jgi:2,4-dienoyl-CoA reductase-like NADH-dependent reductase (Old Yellow Enzyme family)/thioredoxin reductase
MGVLELNRETGPCEALRSPIKIGAKTARNRYVIPAMGTGYATPDGMVTQQLLDYYEARAKGGAGIVIVEITTVEFPRGVHASNKLVADTDLAIPGLSRLAEVIRKHGAIPLLQLCHAGRVAMSTQNGLQPVAPSALAAPGGQVPRALTEDEIRLIVQKFGRAARRAELSGFDGCEVHAAHGYLLATFASRASNKRTDRYGGSLDNRVRFLTEVLTEMRNSTGSEFVIGCRINGQEYGDPEALPLAEGRQIAAKIEPLVNYISVSVRGYGSHSLANYPDTPGELLPIAEAIKSSVQVPVIGVGRVSAEVADSAISQHRVDLIALGRQSIADPDTPKLVLSGRAADVRPCIACFYCADWGAKIDRPISCQVNASVGKEADYQLIPAKVPKKVVVVGAGPAGLEASRILAARGHKVIILEMEPFIGGQLAQAAIPPHKGRLAPFLSYFVRELERLKVDIRTRVKASTEYVQELHPDVVLFAGGATQAIPSIPGASLPNVTIPMDLLYERFKAGQTAVVIGGGLTGCEIAEFLDANGVKTTIVHPHDKLAKDVGANERQRAISHLAERPVNLVLNARCTSISESCVTIRDSSGVEREIPAETVVLACGVRPNNALYEEMQASGLDVHMMGDCWRPGMIATAVADGARWGHSL